MIRDISKIPLTPGNKGKDCLGNGRHYNKKGELIECCCDECSHLVCCTTENYKKLCNKCIDFRCPRCKRKLLCFFKNIILFFTYFFTRIF